MTSVQDKYPPPEIWDQIFSEATYYPGEFDADEWVNDHEFELARRDITSNTSTNRFILYNRMKGATGENFQFQLDTRRSLVLVCKQWYNLAIRHLYGSVIIQDDMVTNLANKIVSDQSLGPLVKRLELKDGVHESHASDLNSLLSNCPNIIIFYDAVGYIKGSTTYWWHLLLRNPTICANLQYAAGVAVGVPVTQFLSFTSSLSSLVALKLPYIATTDITALTSIPISLPNLRILDFGSPTNFQEQQFYSYICSWDLPKLHTVWVPVETAFVVPLTEFWRKHGKKLTTIKIYHSKPSTVGIRLGEVSLGIESIGQPTSEVFPRLRQLIVLHNSKGSYPPLFLPSTSLEIYEVPFHHAAPRYELRDHVLHQIIGYHLKQLPADKVPNLRVFRISNCPTKSDDGPLKEFYAEFWEKQVDLIKAKLEVRGVTLEFVDPE